MCGAVSPPSSSVFDEKKYTSRGGTYPSASRCSADSMRAAQMHFVSTAPRANILPSAISAAKGSCVHSDASADTTSWCAMSTTGASARSAPFHRSEMP